MMNLIIITKNKLASFTLNNAKSSSLGYIQLGLQVHHGWRLSNKRHGFLCETECHIQQYRMRDLQGMLVNYFSMLFKFRTNTSILFSLYLQFFILIFQLQYFFSNLQQYTLYYYNAFQSCFLVCQSSCFCFSVRFLLF